MGQVMGQGYNLVTADIDGPVAQGEGLTYTTSKAAKLWRYRIRLQSAAPVNGTIRAANKADAKKFLGNRHPNLIVIEELSHA